MVGWLSLNTEKLGPKQKLFRGNTLFFKFQACSSFEATNRRISKKKQRPSIERKRSRRLSWNVNFILDYQSKILKGGLMMTRPGFLKRGTHDEISINQQKLVTVQFFLFINFSSAKVEAVLRQIFRLVNPPKGIFSFHTKEVFFRRL